jgi:hypothetical protein
MQGVSKSHHFQVIETIWLACSELGAMRVGDRDFPCDVHKSKEFVPNMVESQKFWGAL